MCTHNTYICNIGKILVVGSFGSGPNFREETDVNERHTDLMNAIRRSRRICNMLSWEATTANPRADSPEKAVKRILSSPRRMERIRKELEKRIEGPIDLESPGNDCTEALIESMRDYWDD